MIELVFIACLATSPEVCEQRALQFVDISPTTCTLGAQPELAKWVETHPRWRVAKWKCQVPSTDRRA